MTRHLALPGLIALAVLLALAPVVAGGAWRDAAAATTGSRAQITAVGSSTLYPFTAIVAERYLANTPGARPPVIESTGTGAGMRLFCAGLGAQHPDVADASRRMRRREYAACEAHGVGAVIELAVGLDGVAVATARDAPAMALTTRDLYRALAAMPDGLPNAARTWRDVNPALPAVPIRVYGPPATSGTRDALAELILARGCEQDVPRLRALRENAPAAFARRCTHVREDGAYIDAGENDNLIVQKLRADPAAIGVFGYSYLEQNAATVRGLALDGVAPDYAAIASGAYPGARPLYLYVKRAHLAAVPGLARFLETYAALWGPDGPLVRRGLIAAPATTRARAAAILRTRRPLDAATLG